MMNISAWLRDRLMRTKPTMMGYLLPLVKHFEGYYQEWYKCTSGVNTIGYGHTGSMEGLQPSPWTEHYAEQVLVDELENDYLPQTIEALAKVGIAYDSLSVAQQAAVVSAVYNSGQTIILEGTWIKRFRQKKSREEVSQRFYLWNKSGGKTSAGLVRRRFSEMKLFWEGKLDFDPQGWSDYYRGHK